MDGCRTHSGPQRDPPPVLKTGEPTGTQPLPELRIPYPSAFGKSVHPASLHKQSTVETFYVKMNYIYFHKNLAFYTKTTYTNFLVEHMYQEYIKNG